MKLFVTPIGKYNSYFLFLLLFLISSCKKDPLILDCTNIYVSGNFTYGPNPNLPFFYNAPYFNPNNGQEFVVEVNDSSGNSSLAIYNLQTGTLKTIYSSPKITDPPKWGVNDWIVFAQGYSLYKIKSNGDSVTQLLTPSSVYNPAWNFDGTKIIYITDASYNVVISDEKGNTLKTFNSIFGYGLAWTQLNHLIASGNGNNGISLINDSTYQVSNIDAAGLIIENGIAWVDNENLFYINNLISNGSIYKVNISTQMSQMIKGACNSKIYNSISISPDKQKILLQTIEITIDNNAHALYTSDGVYIMNIDGSGETKIKLP